MEPHAMKTSNRKTSHVTGVSDIISFDVSQILMETTEGMLLIKGSDLHVNQLNIEKGEVDIEGKLDSFTYSEINAYAAKGESVMKRLFK